MARVKDTGPNNLSAAGKKDGKLAGARKFHSVAAPAQDHAVKIAKVAAAGVESKVESTKKRARKSAEDEEDGHRQESIKATTDRFKRPATKEADQVMQKKVKKSDAKPVESIIERAGRDITGLIDDIDAVIKARARNAEKQLEEDVSPAMKQSKRKTTTINDDEPTHEVISKKAKNVEAKEADDKPAKKSGKSKKVSSHDDSAAAPIGKARKRKSTTDADEDSFDVEIASTDIKPAKKHKKSNKQTEGIVNSVKAAIQDVATAITGGQTSIIEDVSNLAENAIQGKARDKKSAIKTKKGAKSAVEPTETEIKEMDDGESEQWEPEEEIAELITGFESGSEDDESGDEGFKSGVSIPTIPAQKDLTSKERKGGSDGPGVIYIGRIPHGFHEHEMRSYFSQFGDVNHVRLSRSKKTGRSKHYAFLEFKSEEVAKIAAKTMDKYLLFGHILRCSYVPQERVHSSLWKGADKRFKSVPWAKIEGRKLTAPKGRSQWSEKIENETKRRAGKAAKLKELGYEFEPTKLSSVDSVPLQSKQQQENSTEQEKTTVVGKTDDSIVVAQEIKMKKLTSAKNNATPKEVVSDASRPSSSSDDGKRLRRPSKRALEAAESAPPPKKTRKGKKA